MSLRSGSDNRMCLFLIVGKIIKSVPGKLMKEVSFPGCQHFNIYVLTNL